MAESAAEVAQELQLRFVFDALCDDGELEGVSEREDRAHDGRVVSVFAQALHERPVDLDGVDGEAIQVAERRVPRAEVVQADVHPQGSEGGHGLDDLVDAVDQHALGDLEVQQLRRNPGFVDRVHDRSNRVGLSELSGRNVDREPQVGVDPSVRAPMCELTERFAQDPFPDRDDEPAAFGDWDELRWTDGPELGVVPSKQRLETDRFGSGQIEHGLEGEMELLGLQRAPELGLDGELSPCAEPRRPFEDHHSRSAVLLGLIHRGVGVTDERFRRVGTIRQGHADARGERELPACDQDGRRQHTCRSVAELAGGGVAGDVGSDEYELVAAEAADQVRDRQTLTELLGDG